LKKVSGSSCLPLSTLFKEYKFDRSHLQGKTLDDFGMVVVGNLKFQPYSTDLVSTSHLTIKNTLCDSLSKRKIKDDIKRLAAAIECRYKSHTKQALPLKKAREFKYFKLN
jgi:hypothetical protein